VQGKHPLLHFSSKVPPLYKCITDFSETSKIKKNSLVLLLLQKKINIYIKLHNSLLINPIFIFFFFLGVLERCLIGLYSEGTFGEKCRSGCLPCTCIFCFQLFLMSCANYVFARICTMYDAMYAICYMHDV
jgi:hypothetical protein